MKYGLLSVIVLLMSCNQQVNKDEEKNPLEDLAVPPFDWVESRVNAAEKRLMSTDAGNLVWKAIDAHGGLKKWYANGAVAFRFNYQPLGDGKSRDTYQVVDTWSARVRHQLTDRPEISFGWDGKNSWISPDSADLGFDGRFWALTPYYFVGIPFVVADEGINYENLESSTYKDVEYLLVKVTYDQDIGDAPDDYYILYIHPENYTVDAIRYIVSYPDFFPEGGHSPEKFMTYEERTSVEGIQIHRKHRTFKWTQDSIGEQVTDITVENIEFRPEVPNSYFQHPDSLH